MQTKGERPNSYLSQVKLTALVETYLEFNHLKQLYRQGWLQRGVPPAQCESVADHTFGTALLALFVAEASFPELDVLKAVTMALLHEFGEIYAGDLTPQDGIGAEEKHRLEAESVGQVLAKLPNGMRYMALWEEFEAGESPESQLVRQIDRLEMGMQAGVYAVQGLVDPADFLASANRALTAPELRAILAEMEAARGKVNP